MRIKLIVLFVFLFLYGKSQFKWSYDIIQNNIYDTILIDSKKSLHLFRDQIFITNNLNDSFLEKELFQMDSLIHFEIVYSDIKKKVISVSSSSIDYVIETKFTNQDSLERIELHFINKYIRFEFVIFRDLGLDVKLLDKIGLSPQELEISRKLNSGFLLKRKALVYLAGLHLF